MVTIRLSRHGAKKHPFYHIVVTESESARDVGAQISETLRKVLREKSKTAAAS